MPFSPVYWRVVIAALACALLSSCIPFYRAAGMPLRAHCVGSGVSSVSASQDSARFVVSYCDEKKSLIAVGDFSTGHMDVVAQSQDSLYYRPIFLSDGKSLIFIERKTVDKSTIELIDANGVKSQLTQPGENMQNIQDMALSRNNSTIYFINARTYANYSPLAPATERDKDFFSFSMKYEDGTGSQSATFPRQPFGLSHVNRPNNSRSVTSTSS